jgi:hypothetical protein
MKKENWHGIDQRLMTRVVLYRKEVFHDISSMISTGHHQDNKTQAKAKEIIDHGLAAYT